MFVKSYDSVFAFTDAVVTLISDHQDQIMLFNIGPIPDSQEFRE